MPSMHTPFGGEKNSGLGRFGGQWVIDEVTRTHWISVQHAPRISVLTFLANFCAPA
jgi:acyl-CoA reductase-like NAD-dependent aldehyde dehydrogenase